MYIINAQRESVKIPTINLNWQIPPDSCIFYISSDYTFYTFVPCFPMWTALLGINAVNAPVDIELPELLNWSIILNGKHSSVD